MRHFTHVCFYAQTAVHLGSIHTLRTTVILIMEKTQRPQIEPHMPGKDGAGSGISGVYLWFH